MRDIYLISKFSNMDIIILFLFDRFLLLPLPHRPFHPPLPKLRFVVQNIPFLLRVNCPLYRAKKKDYCLYHTRAYTHARTDAHIPIHMYALSLLFSTGLLINR